jgi:hypothetical protein
MLDYPPLSTKTSTRVLSLLEVPRDQELRYTLHEVDLAHAPVYEAISYTWGSAKDQRTIYINDEPVQVRNHLHACLQQLRNANVDAMLWIDALSISQSDLAEKSQQVAMIGRIFRQASRVRLWVGEHADDSETLFRTTQASSKPTVTRRLDDFRLGLTVFLLDSFFGIPLGVTMLISLVFGVIVGLTVDAGWRAGVPAGIGAAALFTILFGLIHLRRHISRRETALRNPAWQAFVKRDYFGRTWIVQEVALAKQIVVHCGNDSTDWTNLIEQHIGYHEHNKETLTLTGRDPTGHFRRLPDENMVFLNMLRQSLLEEDEPEFWTLENLVRRVEHTSCQDQRDRIYSLLSIEKRDPQRPSMDIMPDYTIGVPRLFVDILKTRYPNPDTWPGKTKFESKPGLLSDGLKMTSRQRIRALGLLKRDKALRSALKDVWYDFHGGTVDYLFSKLLVLIEDLRA